MQALYHKVKRQNEKNRRIPNFVSFRDRLGIFPGRKGCYDGLVEASARHAETMRGASLVLLGLPIPYLVQSTPPLVVCPRIMRNLPGNKTNLHSVFFCDMQRQLYPNTSTFVNPL